MTYNFLLREVIRNRVKGKLAANKNEEFWQVWWRALIHTKHLPFNNISPSFKYLLNMTKIFRKQKIKAIKSFSKSDGRQNGDKMWQYAEISIRPTRKANSTTSCSLQYTLPQSRLELASQREDSQFGKARAKDKRELAVKATKHHRRVLHTGNVLT